MSLINLQNPHQPYSISFDDRPIEKMGKFEEHGLVFAIRTDAHHATRHLKDNLKQHLGEANLSENFTVSAHRSTNQASTFLGDYIDQTISKAYRSWGHSVLTAMSQSVDYGKYGLEATKQKHVHTHFYDSRALSRQAVSKGRDFLKNKYGDDVNPVIISLDDLITSHFPDDVEQIAFSRLFSLCGNNKKGYVPRPGHDPITQQLEKIKNILEEKAALSESGRTPILLLEDNVRHAKMLNWLTEQMSDAGLFKYGEIAAISTCFLCADEVEQAEIVFEENAVPVVPVVQYEDMNVDVSTPRDLLFDGLVVEVDEQRGRLPALFMNLEENFKIHPDEVEQFQGAVTSANIAFCKELEEAFGIEIPLRWFAVADPVSHVRDVRLNTAMTDVMAAL